MPPKKAQKMSLNAFLENSALGSWADEMDAVPTGPSGNPDDRPRGLSGAPDRGGRDGFQSDRPPREDLPLPTAPPYTAFIGNLAFDVTESEMGDFFGSGQTKSVKIIKDRDEKPKGFGYVEFADLDSLKDGLAKSGSNFAGRVIRVSVAEPPKERSGPGGAFEDDAKFAGNWRREGPLPPAPDRDPSRRRFEGERTAPPPGVSDGASDWRAASRGPVRAGSGDSEPPRSKRMGFGGSEGTPGAADAEEAWTRGSKFKPSTPSEETSGSKFGGGFKRSEGPPVQEESDWRKSSRPMSRGSQGDSTPPTPARRKLELLPKSSGNSTVPSPLSSPNPASGSSRSNPFGAAKPVDVTAKEAAITERLEKDKDRLTNTMSRTSSRTGTERPSRNMGPHADSPSGGTSPVLSGSAPAPPSRGSSATVKPAFSFAAAAKKNADLVDAAEDSSVENVTQQVAESQI